jgi:uncharacterized protein (DUF2126 family)
MSIQIALHHRSRYTYDRPVAHSPHLIRLRPAPHCRTPILSYSLRITPPNHFINWQQDPFSNYVVRVTIPDKCREFIVDVDLVADMAVYNPFDFFLEPFAEEFPFSYPEPLRKELAPFLEAEPATPLLTQLLAGIDRSRCRSIDFLVQLNRSLAQKIKYVIRLEPGVQSCEQTLSRASGSCRDSGWLLAQILRHLGLASRFVSGYLVQLTPDVQSLDGPSGTTYDFTDLHAWCEVFLPGAGWVGLDPTSGLLAGEGHIPLACTPQPSSASPITGLVDECESKFVHEMSVTRFHETPRVTKPYTNEQWNQIDELGNLVDRDLNRHDVRLTMGGEPTFISIDNMDGDEWNFAAVGPEKLKLSADLIARLKNRFAAGGFFHYGQGKWYPGESLPRWAFSCYWRKDGEPIWKEVHWLASPGVNYGFGSEDARQFTHALASRLGLGPKFVVPAYEDAIYYVWKEKQVPTNVGSAQLKLDKEEERARLARVLEAGLSHTTGYVLPLARGYGHPVRWISSDWHFRGGQLVLSPGDSPMGLRLPLDSLPAIQSTETSFLYEPDPTSTRGALPHRDYFRQAAISEAAYPTVTSGAIGTQRATAQLPRRSNAGAASAAALPGGSAGVIRTALCAEARNGRLYVFVPPLATLEEYLLLLTAIEETAAELQKPVIIEGYPPPHDSRLEQIKVTPDPGVIEVNLHPATNWKDLVHNTTALYEEARLSRLGSEKFMMDGRHVGTGGGNHIVVGGATPNDSPFLRRPDLLRSLLCFWQNHPSLSFLFSGTFIGPTSQHPRVDEARHDALYELELAFKQTPDHGKVPPWLVDRIFRNLLVDLTGNTHRAEFCIDKLYSPESATGRLGLLELRAFEMPPHSRMSLVQQLLLRALISAFWQRPYQRPLVRWGTSLHDRYMLPHFVAEDFQQVVDHLREHGYPVQLDWFLPHLEFRFPSYGSISHRGISLEIRHALEPWHVLGEEGVPGGTTRFVDSSLERLQLKAGGLTDSRYVITCNQRALPLHKTGTQGEYVAGVRYRAWQPSRCLHPTIPVHAPLNFEIFDAWNQQSLGGCTYYVSHPGGLNYTTLPINSFEAESRRLARFIKANHTPGKVSLPAPAINQDFPLTLDLRRE